MIDFAPKGEEVLQAEVLEDLGLEAYEGNEEVVDRVVARRKKDEDFKASLHEDKTKAREKLKEARKLAGLDPETGEKLKAKAEEPKNENLSLKDIRALQDVDDEDVDEVLNFAKFKGISVAEAKVNPVIQALLKTNVETRKSAQAAQVKVSGRSSTKSNDEKILEDFAKGIAPEDPEALARARYNAILKKRKN